MILKCINPDFYKFTKTRFFFPPNTQFFHLHTLLSATPGSTEEWLSYFIPEALLKLYEAAALLETVVEEFMNFQGIPAWYLQLLYKVPYRGKAALTIELAGS